MVAGEPLTGEQGLLGGMLKAALERGLDAELTEHVGYDRGDAEAPLYPNSRNGVSTKTVATELGDIELAVPRDRNGTFTPMLVPKGQRRLDGLDGMIISLYAVLPVTLDDCRGVVGDGGHVRNKAAHIAVGVDMDGIKHVLGIWVQATEGAKFWATVCSELANREVHFGPPFGPLEERRGTDLESHRDRIIPGRCRNAWNKPCSRSELERRFRPALADVRSDDGLRREAQPGHASGQGGMGPHSQLLNTPAWPEGSPSAESGRPPGPLPRPPWKGKPHSRRVIRASSTSRCNTSTSVRRQIEPRPPR